MAGESTTERVLRVLTLLQRRPSWTAAELAAELGVTPRSVRRDVTRLRSLGYPVHATAGVGGGYQLGAGTRLPPLLLDEEESIATAVSLRMASGGTIAGAGEAALRALAKLDQVMPPRLRAEVRAVHEATDTLSGQGSQIRSELLLTLARACRDGVRVRFHYAGRPAVPAGRDEDRAGAGAVNHPRPDAAPDDAAPDDAAPSRSPDGSSDRSPDVAPDADRVRTVEPVRMVTTGQRWYLMAFDLDRDDWRTFRLDRMSAVAATTWRIRPREHPDPVGFVQRAVSQGPYPYLARVRLRAPAERIRELVPPAAGRVESDGVDWCVLVAGATDLAWLAVHVAQLGCEAQVLEPPELRQAAARLAQQLGGVAGSSDLRSPRLPGDGSGCEVSR